MFLHYFAYKPKLKFLVFLDVFTFKFSKINLHSFKKLKNHCRFQLRKKTRYKVMKLGRVVCWTLKSVGMMIIRAKKARHTWATRKIQSFVRKFAYRWLEKRRVKARKMIYDFLKYRKGRVHIWLMSDTLENENKIDLKCVKYYNTMWRVQTRVKTYLARRKLRYAILDRQWDRVELNIMRKSKNKFDEPEISNSSKLGKFVTFSIWYLVPWEIRKIYLQEYLRYQRITYTYF